MVTPGATLIDVGINRINRPRGVRPLFLGRRQREATFAKRGSTLVGDIDPKAYELAGAYTPVPGGVGPLDHRHADGQHRARRQDAARTLDAESRSHRRPGQRQEHGCRGGARAGGRGHRGDELGRALMEPGQAVFSSIVERFGPEVVNSDGKLNRARLAEMAFKGRTGQRAERHCASSVIAAQRRWMEQVLPHPPPWPSSSRRHLRGGTRCPHPRRKARPCWPTGVAASDRVVVVTARTSWKIAPLCRPRLPLRGWTPCRRSRCPAPPGAPDSRFHQGCQCRLCLGKHGRYRLSAGPGHPTLAASPRREQQFSAP